jgi:hypothetical protein
MAVPCGCWWHTCALGFFFVQIVSFLWLVWILLTKLSGIT